jgi:hypothetical protein
MENEMKYEFEDNEIIIRESGDCIYLSEYNNYSELNFRIEDSEKVIALLESIKSYMECHGCNYVDLSTYESEDEDGDPTGEYHWCDEYVMDDEDINPYFSPDDEFYGNSIYRDDIPYILEALSEYLNPSSLDGLDKLSLKSILRLKRNLANEN